MTARLMFSLILVLVGLPSEVGAKVKSRVVPYTYGEKAYEGFLAWDDSVEGKRPGILVVHEWWGLNDYARSRAEQLAALGYATFAVDMYGKGKVTTHSEKASEWAKLTTSNLDEWFGKAQEGLKILQTDPNVDPTRLAAIGYCFGGATVMQLVYGGAPVKGVVSFHGSLPLPPDSKPINHSAKVLIAHGASDPFLKADHIGQFQTALNTADIDWQMVWYSGAQHSFTNPSADQYGLNGAKYNQQADQRSWMHMRQFFDELFH
ncbi:MAG: dienelactone hydrolase family protein [Nitrospirota bacterium]|nr:dienelactone hydrolase family protein [Nitrospirota bacterium]